MRNELDAARHEYFFDRDAVGLDVRKSIPVHSLTMTSRLAGLLGLAALAFASTACTYKTQTQLGATPVDYSDYAFYDRPFGASPSDGVVKGDTAPLREAASRDVTKSADDGEAPTKAHGRGNAASVGLGFTAGGSPATAEATATEYEEVEATPGTPCYEAAVKAGIQSGVCTLVSERKYVLVGEKAR